MPTVGHEPPGSKSPWDDNWLYASISWVPAPMETIEVPDGEPCCVAVVAVDTPRMGDTSMTSPGPEE